MAIHVFLLLCNHLHVLLSILLVSILICYIVPSLLTTKLLFFILNHIYKAIYELFIYSSIGSTKKVQDMSKL
jgi:hypothetical protein